MNSRLVRSTLFVVGVFVAFQAVFISGAIAVTWTQTGSGPFTWNDTANWTPAMVPNAISEVASFTTAGGPATQSVTLDLGVVLGTLDLTNAATSYSISNGSGGSLIFNNGASAGAIAVGSGALAQVIDTDITVGAVQLTVTHGSTNALTFNGQINNGGFPLFFNISGPAAATNAISGSGPLYKRGGTSTLTLSGANTYSGGTYFGQPTQAGANIGTIALTGGDDRLLNTSTVFFHPVNFATGGTYTCTLDVGSTSQTLSTIHLPGADGAGTSQAPTGAAVTISGNGGTLRLNGDNLNIGIATNATYTGTLTHNVNMSTLSNFVFDNSSKQVAVQLMGANRSQNQAATLTMAANNTVTASNFLVGNTGPGGSVGGGASTVTLGSGVNTFTIGSSNSAGAVNVGFAGRSTASMTLPAGGSLTIRGYNSGASGGSNPLPEFNIGRIFNSNDTRAFTDTVNFSSGTIDAIVTNMTVGMAGDLSANGNRTGTTNASFLMGDGTLTVDNLTIGAMRLPSGTTVGINGATSGSPGTLIANGTFTLNHMAGVLQATTINVAENTDTGASLVAGVNSATVNGTLALNNGTVRATTIQQPHTMTSIASANPKINWTAGTIENIVGANLTIDGVPTTLLTSASHTFNATGANAIIQNTNAPISGLTFGITKTGTGTLIYNANNTYTGLTTVSQGTLLQNGAHSGGGAYVIENSGTLGGSGLISGVVTLLAGSNISPGTSPGTLAVGGLTIGDNSSSVFELNATDTTVGSGINDLIDIDGLLDVSGANAGTVTVNIVKVGGGSFDAVGTWTLMTYDLLNPGSFNPNNIIINGLVAGYSGSIGVIPDDISSPTAAGKVVLNVVPESSSITLIMLGLTVLPSMARRKWKTGC